MSKHLLGAVACSQCEFLPTEILLTIFECLDGDKETLRSCTLVCRAWLPLSHSQLFRSIHFRPPPKGHRDCFVKFLGFFIESQVSGSNLGRHVEDLTFSGDRRQVSYNPHGLDKYHDRDDVDRGPDDDTGFVKCQLDVLTSLGSVFTQLKRLTLVKLTIVDDLAFFRRNPLALADEDSDGDNGVDDEGRGTDEGLARTQNNDSGSDDEDGNDDEDESDEDDGSDDEDGSDDGGPGAYSGIDDPIKVLPADCIPLAELRFNEVYSAFDTYRDIFQVICSFTEIAKLSLEFMPWTESKRGGSNPESWFVDVTPQHCPVIRTLDLEDPFPFLVRTFHALLQSSGALEGTLQSLKFRGGMDGMKEIEAFRPLLVDAGPHLCELNLDLWSRMYRKPGALNHWREIPVSRCTALESLILPIGHVPFFDNADADYFASRTADIVDIYTGWLSEWDSLPALRSVTFEVLLNHEPTYWFRGSRERHQSAWRRMAKHLASRPLERVSIVMFTFWDRDSETAADRAELEEFFASPMAPLQSKGILNVRFVRKPTFQELFY